MCARVGRDSAAAAVARVQVRNGMTFAACARSASTEISANGQKSKHLISSCHCRFRFCIYKELVDLQVNAVLQNSAF